jgi:hypothetical protein
VTRIDAPVASTEVGAWGCPGRKPHPNTSAVEESLRNDWQEPGVLRTGAMALPGHGPRIAWSVARQHR